MVREETQAVATDSNDVNGGGYGGGDMRVCSSMRGRTRRTLLVKRAVRYNVSIVNFLFALFVESCSAAQTDPKAGVAAARTHDQCLRM